MSPIIQIAIAITGLGALGGLTNALVTDKAIKLPRKQTTAEGTVWVPGIFGNLFVSALAALISWILYGPAALTTLIGGAPDAGAAPEPTLTLGALGAAALVGFGGARWWTVEADKKLQRQAIRDLAQASQPRQDVIAEIDKGASAETLMGMVRRP